MKLVLAYIMYVIGDVISWLLNWNCCSWLYPTYNKLMILSCDLDIHNKLWKKPKS